jgi:hypothetical protein
MKGNRSMTEDKTDQAAATEEVAPKPFATFLLEHARGRTHDELSRKLRDLLAAIDETGKGGSITYKLSIKPEAKTGGAVLVTDDVKATLPVLDRPASIFFVDSHYRLCRNDPRQLTLDALTNGQDD